MARIDGMKELEKMFRELGKVPQRTANKSAKAGASIIRKEAKANAPEDEGDLEKGIILKKERSRVQGKAVYDVMMDPAMNDKFVKESLDGGRSYYPASMEYGFMTVDGGYIPGYRYMRNAADDNGRSVERKVLETAAKDVDKALRG